MLISVIGIIVVLGILIFVHESGHFIAAKIMGVRVEKFSMGFGPKLLAKRAGKTEYRLSLIPLGGYVKLAGEQMDEQKAAEPWEFFGKKPWRRAIILAAGPFMNFLLAWVIFSSVLYLGSPVYKAVIGEVKAGEPAQTAGLIPGDKVLFIDDKRIENWPGLAATIYQSPGEKLSFNIERDGRIINLDITPRIEDEIDPLKGKVSKGLIGILPDAEEIYYHREPLPAALIKGTGQTLTLTKMIYIGLWRMVSGKISVRHLGGPILIAQLTAQQIKIGLLPLLTFLALISVNLAVINLLPIPILDGGHLMFLAAEKIKGRPLSVKAQELAQMVGLYILVAIMLFATYNDIMRAFVR